MHRYRNCRALLRACLFSLFLALPHGLKSKRTAKYAIVQPFFSANAEDLGKHSSALFAKCSRTYPIDLVLFYQGKEGDIVTRYNVTVPEMVRGLTRKPHLGSCFNDVRLALGNVTLGTKYPFAPGKQFFNMLRMTPPMWGYAAIYQMELDVMPLHGGWLAGLLAVFDKSVAGDAWVVGGVYQAACMKIANLTNTGNEVLGFMVDGKRRQHINGNAIYVPRKEFIKWSLPLQQKTERGYDFLLFREMLANSKISKDKFREDPLFVDCRPTRRHGGYTLPLAEIIKAFPQAMLAHTRFLSSDNFTYLETDDPPSISGS